VKSLLDEVRIEREGCLEGQPAHNEEACAVHKAQLASVCGEESRDGGIMIGLRYPVDLDSGKEVVQETANRGETTPMLKHGDGFNDDVVRGEERRICLEEVFPGLDGSLVLVVGRVQTRQKGGGIHEDSQAADASAKYVS